MEIMSENAALLLLLSLLLELCLLFFLCFRHPLGMGLRKEVTLSYFQNHESEDSTESMLFFKLSACETDDSADSALFSKSSGHKNTRSITF